MGVRRLEALPVRLPLTRPRPGGQGKRPQFLFVHNVLIQHNDKLRPLGIDAVHADLSAHQLHQLLDDAQPQSRSLNITVPLLIHPAKRVKNVGNILFFYPLSSVLHRVPDAHPVELQALTPDGEGDGALAGILHRVIQQVDQHLLDTHLVSTEHAGDRGVHMELEFQALFPGLNPYHIDDFRKERASLIGDVDDLHFSGFDLGDVQNIIDQREQQLAGPLDISGVLRHFL